MLEAFDFFLFEFFFGFSPDGRSIRLTIFDEVPEDAGEFVGHSRHGLGGVPGRVALNYS